MNRSDLNQYWAIVPAAGTGSRMQANKPKQYLEIFGQPIIALTLGKLISTKRFSKIVVALNESDSYWSSLGLTKSADINTVIGGETRMHSVLAGLHSFANLAKSEDWVLVHDAARPNISVQLIEKLIISLSDDKVGGLLGLPVTDTVKQVSFSGEVEASLLREKIWLAQTPQMFRYGLLRDAIEDALQQGVILTDESSALERMGYRPKMVLGEATNIKVTTMDDLAILSRGIKEV
jgi:2-C-methyl-D-erythritol 4-phosphate cytidylyltransferase